MWSCNCIILYGKCSNEWYARDISKKRRISNKIKGNSGEPMGQPPYGYQKDPDNPKRWIVDETAAAVVRRIYRMSLDGMGVEQIADALSKEEILTPRFYWQAKGVQRAGKPPKYGPCHWNSSTVTKILTLQEYCGDVLNFKTYSKSYKNKRRIENDRENWAIFKDVHEAIIDRTTWEKIQERRGKVRKRRTHEGEKHMFSGLLVCADCGNNLHFHFNQGNPEIEYFNCSNYKGNRGTCNETHYIRADSLEQVVLLELNRMVSYLKNHAEEFAELLAQKTTKDYERESRNRQQRLQELMARNKEVDRLFERIYEDNVSGKLTDDRFMKMSQRYDEEQQQLKKDIEELQRQCDSENDRAFCKEQFLKAVRKFMEMKTLTPTILHELVERIDVYQTQGRGKNRTQRIVIHYNFIGVLDLPEVEEYPENVVLDSRQGVAIEYLVGKAG